MQINPTTYPLGSRDTAESSVSAISWAAIFAGSVVAASTTLVLLLIGAGFGFASISPWPNASTSPVTFTIIAGVWLIVVQWVSAGLGGYITGRLRTKWVQLHTHEVFFRDTAHGLLTWGFATVVGAFLMASAGSSAIGTATNAAATIASGAAANNQTSGAAAQYVERRAYDVDSLFRGEKPELAASGREAHQEATRIFAATPRSGEMAAADRNYLVDMVSQRTGVARADAEKRVNDVMEQEKRMAAEIRQAADTARKSAAAVSFFTAVSMLIGAFIACAAAAYGGSLRDEHP